METFFKGDPSIQANGKHFLVLQNNHKIPKNLDAQKFAVFTLKFEWGCSAIK